MPTDGEAKQRLEAEPYRVGYKKLPLDARFGAQRQPSARASERTKVDIAALLDEPLQVKSKGKRTKMHLHEATLHGLFKRVLKGETGAIQQFLDYCRRAAVFEPNVFASSGQVIGVPNDVPADTGSLLLQKVGPPPWDAEILKPTTSI
ncbi:MULTISPECIES: hypothetical protein [Bradyrhizobium]|uniref:hypothetical protein n=1 Tax=Bradyrhizobium TaxID=374 RepID=UPI001ED9C8D4|nr:hypothetical protein [Bradyrhizobium zhengyangense]MCG2645527.1 hypothetical protein [Bradyrhizobium zhengyangense]